MDAAPCYPGSFPEIPCRQRCGFAAATNIGMSITLLVQFAQRSLCVLATMGIEEIQADDLSQSSLELCDFRARRRSGVKQCSRRLCQQIGRASCRERVCQYV